MIETKIIYLLSHLSIIIYSHSISFSRLCAIFLLLDKIPMHNQMIKCQGYSSSSVIQQKTKRRRRSIANAL